jgi:hypothetical protein
MCSPVFTGRWTMPATFFNDNHSCWSFTAHDSERKQQVAILMAAVCISSSMWFDQVHLFLIQIAIFLPDYHRNTEFVVL